MRQRIFYGNDENLCGEFPHDPEIGFQSGKRGLRRRLVSASECNKEGESEAMTLAFSRYSVKEKEIREKQFVKNKTKTRSEYEKKNITFKDAAKVWLDDVKTTLSKKTHSLYSKTIDIYLDNIENHRLQDFNRAHNMKFFTALESVKSPRGDKGPITSPHRMLTCANSAISYTGSIRMNT
jgi:hypothetical protein